METILYPAFQPAAEVTLIVGDLCVNKAQPHFRGVTARVIGVMENGDLILRETGLHIQGDPGKFTAPVKNCYPAL